MPEYDTCHQLIPFNGESCVQGISIALRETQLLPYLLSNIKGWSSISLVSCAPEGINTRGAFEASLATGCTHASLLLQPFAS